VYFSSVVTWSLETADDGGGLTAGAGVGVGVGVGVGLWARSETLKVTRPKQIAEEGRQIFFKVMFLGRLAVVEIETRAPAWPPWSGHGHPKAKKSGSIGALQQNLRQLPKRKPDRTFCLPDQRFRGAASLR
jgi:hypothetical protein